MANTVRRWLPVAAAILSSSLDGSAASFSGKITSAELDDIAHGEVQAIVKYVVRAPKGSVVTAQTLRISGESFTPVTSKPQQAQDVGTLVLIDAGEPAHPHLSAKVQDWVKKLAKLRPDWTYRFIAGDQNGCLVSPDLMDDPKARSAFQQQLVDHPDQALGMQPYAPTTEQMDKMVALFSTQAHTLVVLAPQAPSWLPREVTEWLTRDVPIENRKPRGIREQIRVRSGDADAIHEVEDWIRLGYLRVVLLPDDPQQDQSETTGTSQTGQQQKVLEAPRPDVPDAQQALRHGVEDVLTGNRTPATVEELVGELTANPSLVEYRGTAIAPVTEIQRLASGPFTAELAIAVDKNGPAWTREAAVLDRAVKNWTPQMLQQYVSWLPYVAGGILLFAFGVDGLRKRHPFDKDFAERSRNCIFACAAFAFAVGANLMTSTSSRLQYLACRHALLWGLVLIVGGVIYWIAYDIRRQFDESMPALGKVANA
jgi:hypothetical protein